jgi:hypothetical protein
LWDFYRIDIRDVFRATLSPRRAWIFIERLMDEPKSRLRAEINGDRWFGYSRELQAIDDVYNLLGLQVQVSRGVRRPKTDHFKQPPNTQKKPVTNVATFNISGLAAQINQ